MLCSKTYYAVQSIDSTDSIGLKAVAQLTSMKYEALSSTMVLMIMVPVALLLLVALSTCAPGFNGHRELIDSGDLLGHIGLDDNGASDPIPSCSLINLCLCVPGPNGHKAPIDLSLLYCS